MIFVDTGAFYASAVPDDVDHLAADSWFSANREPLITTDYVVDETLTLFKTRQEYARGIRLGEQLFARRIARIETVTAEDFYDAWIIFSRYRDKGWSFTDCTSRVVMERLRIQAAFAFDEHFRQFGNVVVVP